MTSASDWRYSTRGIFVRKAVSAASLARDSRRRSLSCSFLASHFTMLRSDGKTMKWLTPSSVQARMTSSSLSPLGRAWAMVMCSAGSVFGRCFSMGLAYRPSSSHSQKEPSLGKTPMRAPVRRRRTLWSLSNSARGISNGAAISAPEMKIRGRARMDIVEVIGFR